MCATIMKDSRGLTFIEVIVVLVLISLLAAVVMARQHTSSANLPARTQLLKAHLRFAQSRAMNSDTSWGVQFINDGTSYRLFNSIDSSIDRALPGEDTVAVDLSTYGLSVDQGDVTISFDTWGRPCSDTDGTSLYAWDQELTLDDTEGNTNSITITQNTGYIP